LIYRNCTKYFLPNEDSIPFKNLYEVVAVLSAISNINLSSLTHYIIGTKSGLVDKISWDYFFLLVKQWINGQAVSEDAEELLEPEKLNIAFNKHEAKIKAAIKTHSHNKEYLLLYKMRNSLPSIFKAGQIELCHPELYYSDIIDLLTKYIVKNAQRKNNISRGLNFEEIFEYVKNFLIDNPDIMIKLSEEEQSLDRSIKETIKQYEDLMFTRIEEGKDVSDIKEFLLALKTQAGKLSKRSDHSDDKMEHHKLQEDTLATMEQQREDGVRKVFSFYCRQQRMLGKNPSFDQMEAAVNHMNMGEFLRFCKDFMIPIKNSKLKLLFIRYSISRLGVNIDSFVALLQEMAFLMLEEKIEGCQVNLNKVIGELLCMENNSELYDEKLYKKLLTEKQHYEKEIYYLEQKNDHETLLDFYCFLECDEPANYKRKMKSISLPFNTKDKSVRVPPSSCPRGYKKKTRSDIQRTLNKIKHDRLQKKQEKVHKNKCVRDISQPKKYLKQASITNDTPYTKEMTQKSESKKELNNKITWDVLNNIKYKDILPSNDPEFKPTDFISNIDDIKTLLNTNILPSTNGQSEYNFSVTSNLTSNVGDGITAQRPLNEKYHQRDSRSIKRPKGGTSIGQHTMSRANQIENQEKSQETIVLLH